MKIIQILQFYSASDYLQKRYSNLTTKAVWKATWRLTSWPLSRRCRRPASPACCNFRSASAWGQSPSKQTTSRLKSVYFAIFLIIYKEFSINNNLEFRTFIYSSSARATTYWSVAGVGSSGRIVGGVRLTAAQHHRWVVHLHLVLQRRFWEHIPHLSCLRVRRTLMQGKDERYLDSKRLNKHSSSNEHARTLSCAKYLYIPHIKNISMAMNKRDELNYKYTFSL